MKKDTTHIEIRDYIKGLMNKDLTAEEIAEIMNFEVGSRFVKFSTKWYMYCVVAKRNQKKAIKKHPGLYSKAGKIAQKKHPRLGYELGKKYAQINGKKRVESLRKEGKLSEHMSNLAKRLQAINPNHSRLNMKKAHETMKEQGTFSEHQRKAALKCMENNPNQLKEMSKTAHEKYPLTLLALESRRRNYPYRFMNCHFDSNEERKLCEIFIQEGLMKEPIEKVNGHIRIKRCHVDFFVGNKVFVEYHPTRNYGRTSETSESYYNERRKLLNDSGFKNYSLVIIKSLRSDEIKTKLEEIKNLLHSPSY